MTELVYPACVPELTDGHALLRPHRPSDADRMVEQSRDPDSLQWTTVPRPYRPEDAREFLAHIEAQWNDPAGDRLWAVTDANDPRHAYLGTIDARPRAGGTMEVGYGLHPDARGRGLMASALRLICQWWFEGGGTRVHWRAMRGNFGSWRVAWSCGFRMHGTVPELLPSVAEGRAVDAWVASLGADDVMEAITPWEDPRVLTSDGRGRHPAAGLARRGRRGGRGPRPRPAGAPDAGAGRARRRDLPGVAAGPARADGRGGDGVVVRRRRRHRPLPRRGARLRARGHAGRRHRRARLPGAAERAPARRGHRRGPALRRARAGAPAAGRHGPAAAVAQTAEDNVGSNRVLDSIGFTLWGTETAADALPGGPTVDALHWELLADA